MTPLPLGYRTLLHETLERSAAEAPGKIAVVAGDARCTYRELDRWSAGVAATLVRGGVRRGDRVAVFMDNSVEAAAAIYGILRTGAAFVVVNPQTRTEKLAYIANDCGIRALVADHRRRPVLEAAVPAITSLKQVVMVGAEETEPALRPSGARVIRWEDAIAAHDDSAPAPGIVPPDLASLIYTSGSTGNPKGVMHTHQSMVFALGSVREYLELDDDVILNVLPLAFDYGLYQLLMAVSIPATLILEPSFTYPGQILQALREHQVTVVPGVPTVFSMLIEAHGRAPLAFPSVRTVTNTAAGLPPDYLTPLREIFPNARIFAMYGLTECKRVAYLDPELLDERPGSVGRAIPGSEVLIRSPDGKAVEDGTPGILHVRGPHLMRGYWNAPDQTAEMLVDGDLPGEKWLRTGDWFRTDPDGFLYFLGRSDDIIKSRGEKVSPTEVENALCSVPGVAEAAVVGVPDETLGQAVKAFVVAKAGADLDARQLRGELVKRLEGFMVPRDIEFRDSLPRSANGKVRKKDLIATDLT